LIGGGGVGGGTAAGGSSYSISANTVYTTGHQSGDGSITIEFYTNPTFKFSCTKSIQNLTVPLGYNYMYVDMSGAAAGSGAVASSVPGYGARVQSYLSVTPGTVLQIAVGCRAPSCPIPSISVTGPRAGGYNGGGAGYGQAGPLVYDIGGSGGGGASDIRMGGLAFSNRVVVAGGGGGVYCGDYCGPLKGGDGGKYGKSGSAPTSACGGYNHASGGGGDWTTGGIAGYSSSATAGGLGVGGNGGAPHSGGGGGGYFGGITVYISVVVDFYFLLLGGGGGDGGGAGGGSSYSTGSNTVYTTGYQTGDGSITIEFYTNPTFKFSCTKSIQNLTVPLGYNYMYVDMSGAASGSGGAGGAVPGYGARIQSYLSVTPGAVLHVTVGCQGISCPASNLGSPTYVTGGYNGGGASYGLSGYLGSTSGGGASDIRIGGMSLYNRVIIAGGGGGYYCGIECGTLRGGDGGRYGKDGSLSSPGTCPDDGRRVAGGGNWTSGGSAGGSVGGPYPTRGSLGFGGNGGYANAGGGGGGYYGGD
jgi:hypothetical protein